MAHTLDFGPLTDPIDRSAVAAWKKAALTSGAFRRSQTAAMVLGIGVVAPIGLLLVGGLCVVASFAIRGAITSGNPLGVVVASLIFTLLAGVAVLLVVKLPASAYRRWESLARTDRFAAANGMRFSLLDKNPSYQGMIFQRGTNRASYEHLVSVDGRFFDMGNYRWVASALTGNEESSNAWGFMALNLDRRLPNMVLDATSNNFVGTNLPAPLDKTQVLHLEGDFDKYFTLYCPKQYERDALYVFTPDLMALLIDEAAPFDVEIVDDWMFVYSDSPFRAGDAATYARLFRIIDTVGAKTLTQTDRYVDERVGNFAANVVAPQGARLTRSVWGIVITIAVVVVGFWAFNLIALLTTR